MKKFIILTSIALAFANVGALAAETTPAKKASTAKSSPPNTEMRQKMAEAHEKMAECLRSDKPIKDCHKEMHKQCQESSGGEECPMMGKMGKGMRHDHKDHEHDEK